MLELILAVVVAGLVALLVVLAYRQGVRDGRAQREDRPPAPMLPPRGRRARSKELKRLDAVLGNLDAYNGTPAGQKEVR